MHQLVLALKAAGDFSESLVDKNLYLALKLVANTKAPNGCFQTHSEPAGCQNKLRLKGHRLVVCQPDFAQSENSIFNKPSSIFSSLEVTFNVTSSRV